MALLNPRKVSTGSISSIENLCSALSVSLAEIYAALSLPDEEKYAVSQVFKSDGSVRLVHNPHFLLRKIQRRINKRIFSRLSIIEWPDHLYGSVPNQREQDTQRLINKDYVSCAAKHCGAKSLLKVDVKDFFDNIHKDLVLDIFSNFMKFDREVSELLAEICCFRSHVIQGALTSSYLASLCLHDIEGAVVHRLSRKGLVYTRLVDDITVSSKISNYDFSYALDIIRAMLTSKDLPLNVVKTRSIYVSSEPLTVHGLRVAFPQPRLPSGEIARIRAAVKNIENLASERGYRTTHAYRHDFNRCMGRVNKLVRVGHDRYDSLLARLKKIFPLPSKKDIERARAMLDRLARDCATKRSTYWYAKRYYKLQERLIILKRSFPAVTKEIRKSLKGLKPDYE
ncbi:MULTISPECIES: reverse transcriptase family protein [Pseudomonas]|jgi:RNA-directed DNA polymerase|uniref:reverse transcriptase family protein n=1 Tax=Pseudomonas TaxID=286 RepID=UPI0018D7D27B|nr:reverse transcriptase family protein [Pseudomonas putida]MBH3417859.1 RNA-directed DNA polymerase [Pseudomonas putida]MDG9816061.1 reverse transcriptase family protein [Pseudomonas putida]